MFPLLVHTNSEYFDVLELFLKTASRYDLFDNTRTIFLTDEPIKHHECIVYNTNDSYSKRIFKALDSIDSQSIMFLHEDFILYDRPDYHKINDLNDLLNISEFDFIRLIRSNDQTDTKIFDSIYLSKKFAIQASIFKKFYLKKYMDTFMESNIWELEAKSSLFDSKGIFYYNKEPKRGAVHYDSSIFPYMATAIVKGKWNSEYRNELLKLANESYFSNRGWTS